MFTQPTTHPELDTLKNSMSSPRQRAVHKLTLSYQAPASEPPGAISKTSSGYKVNDLNPSNGIQNFGTSATKGEAEKHLRAIEYFKHGGTR